MNDIMSTLYKNILHWACKICEKLTQQRVREVDKSFLALSLCADDIR